MPDVSVLMPVYNMKRYPRSWIERTFDSVLNKQSGIDVEVCIGDDASTDSTRKILRGMIDKDRRIKVAYAPRNTGGSDAVNLAAEMATGRYFILLSLRSWYEPDSISRMVTVLDGCQDIGFTYGHNRYYDERYESRVIVRPRYHEEIFKTAFASGFGYLYRREAWDAGCRYGCNVWIEEANRWMTMGDRHMVMQLIFTMKYTGHRCDWVTLNYQRGIIPQMNDLLMRNRKLALTEYRKLWAHIGAA